MEVQAQIAALEAARAKAAAPLFAEIAESGNAIVTLRGLKSAPHLNDTLATIVANNVAPRKPTAGRMAVRIADGSVIAVKYEHASPVIATGTRVAVSPELAISEDGGFQVEASLGSVVACDGKKCRVLVDGAHGRAPLGAMNEVTVEPWTNSGSLVLEASFVKQAELIATAAAIDVHARAIQAAGTAEARQLGVARLRSAADAAGKWCRLENHVGMRSLAALNQLAALRRILHVQVVEAAAHSALVTLKEATSLLGRTELWERFPGPVMTRYYVECANIYLQKANLALGYPHLRSATDTHDSVMEDLNFARQYAEALKDDGLRFMVLNRMVICLTSFKRPIDTITARGATHVASDLGRAMLTDLAAADEILAEHATAALRAASGEQCDVAGGPSAGYWEANRTDLLGARGTLLSWLGEDDEQRALLRRLIRRADEHSPSDAHKRAVHRVNLMRLLPPSDPEARELQAQVRALMPPQQECIICGSALDAPPPDFSLDVTHDAGTCASPATDAEVKILFCTRHLAHTVCHRKWGDAAVERMGPHCTEPWAVRARCPVCLDVTPAQCIRKR